MRYGDRGQRVWDGPGTNSDVSYGRQARCCQPLTLTFLRRQASQAARTAVRRGGREDEDTEDEDEDWTSGGGRLGAGGREAGRIGT